MFNHDGGMFFGGGFMWLLWIAFIVVIVLFLKNIINADKPSTNSNNDSPIKILQRRYASGEIDEAEFEKKRKQLEK